MLWSMNIYSNNKLTEVKLTTKTCVEWNAMQKPDRNSGSIYIVVVEDMRKWHEMNGQMPLPHDVKNYFAVCCGPTYPSYLLITLTTCAIREMGLPILGCQATDYKTYCASSEDSLRRWCTYVLHSSSQCSTGTCAYEHTFTYLAVQCSAVVQWQFQIKHS